MSHFVISPQNLFTRIQGRNDFCEIHQMRLYFKLGQSCIHNVQLSRSAERIVEEKPSSIIFTGLHNSIVGNPSPHQFETNSLNKRLNLIKKIKIY